MIRKEPGEIEAEILMTRQTHKGSFLLVEGDDDSRFWRMRVAEKICEVVLGGGKPNVVGAIGRLDNRRFRGALGIVDADFDPLENRPLSSVNLIATDTHDLEGLLLRSYALERLLVEYGNRRKIEKFEKDSGLKVREALLERGLVFGRLRWLALRQGWSLDFRQYPPERFIKPDTWTVNAADLVKEISQNVGISIEAIDSLLKTLQYPDPWRICQGHDLLAILRLGLQKVLGNLKSNKGVKDLAALLRTAFHKDDLANTRLHADIRVWEKSNRPYRILT